MGNSEELYGEDIPLKLPPNWKLIQQAQESLMSGTKDTQAHLIDALNHGGFITMDAETAETKSNVIYVVHFPQDGIWAVCYESYGIAERHHIPRQFYDYQHQDFVAEGFGFYTIECIHVHFNKKVGYGKYESVDLPEEIANRLFGTTGELWHGL